ncbi:hypothetical protein F2Q70_00011319 [Brassica cretica]|uniref:Uncharacterized protein n=1 Tax=Brassica cretica TaxID=69181 RepID=A0A8S9MBX7_BRACR|nr:hypothetical protein F2Q70_00011319 [Brassica cretica]
MARIAKISISTVDRNPSVSPTTVDKLHHHAPFGTITSSQKHINASAHISIVTLSPLRRHRNKKQNVVTCLHLHLVSPKASGSTHEVSQSSLSDPATVLANLNTKVFPLTPVVLPDGDSSASIQFIQSNILQAMSQLFHLGERMDDHASLRADLVALTSQLREEKDNVLAKEKEIKALKLKVTNQDEAGTLAAAKNVSLREQLEHREEEICDLRCAAETFDVEKTMAVSGAIVVTRWELMREWLNHLTDSWDLEGTLERYKMMKTSEAEFMGIPAPSFEGEPKIPSKTEAEKTPEPAADDPPTYS